MNKRILYPVASALTVGALVAHRAVAQPAPQALPSSNVALPPASGEAAVVDAANAFLATLTAPQRATVQIALTSRLAAKWSNFPAGFSPRNGLFFRDLNATQMAAALKVARLALSREGYTRLAEVRAADDAFAKIDKGPGGGAGGPGGPPPNGGGPGGPPPGFGGPGGPGGGAALFGSGNYIIAFLGEPSRTKPWLLQLGGHHIAINIYYKGNTGTSTPYFVGVQPITWKAADGKIHAPLAPLRDSMYTLLQSLTPAQRDQARLSGSFRDVLVGPGQDGRFPALREGVSASVLSPAAQARLKTAISAWIGDSAQAASYQKLYEAELKETKISWSGSTAMNTAGDYARIDGPRVWIEFVCQAGDHYHTIWRDRKSDYGASFAF